MCEIDIFFIYYLYSQHNPILICYIYIYMAICILTSLPFRDIYAQSVSIISMFCFARKLNGTGFRSYSQCLLITNILHTSRRVLYFITMSCLSLSTCFTQSGLYELLNSLHYMVVRCVPRMALKKKILEKLEVTVDFEKNSYYICGVKWLAEIIQENIHCQHFFVTFLNILTI